MKYLFIIITIVLISCTSSDETGSGNKKPVINTELEDKLEKMKQNFIENASKAKINDYEEAIRLIDDSGLLMKSMNVDSIAPNFKLPSSTGDSVELYDILVEKSVILIWYRGGWCPYCNVQLQSYSNYLNEIHELGAELIAISPEMPDSTISTSNKNMLDFLVLSDLGNKVAKDYNIVFELPQTAKKYYEGNLNIPEYNQDSTWSLPIPATYIIDTDKVIKYAYLDADYRRRAEPSLVIEFLREILQSEQGNAQ